MVGRPNKLEQKAYRANSALNPTAALDVCCNAYYSVVRQTVSVCSNVVRKSLCECVYDMIL